MNREPIFNNAEALALLGGIALGWIVTAFICAALGLSDTYSPQSLPPTSSIQDD